MAMNELRDAVVQVKSEVTPGQAETTGFTTIEINGTDSAGVLSPDLAFVEATVLRPDFDQRPGTPGRAKSNISIPSYATAKPAADPVAPTPANGILLKACGLSETVSGESCTYTPTTTDQSMTVWSFNDGIKTISAGVRGGFSLDMSAGQYPTMSFTGEGDYTAPSNGAVPVATYPNEILHQVATASMTIGGVSGLVIRNFSFTWDVTQTERLDVNSSNGYKGTAVTAKVGRISTTVEFQDSTSTWNPEALLTAGATHAVNLEVGDFTAGASGSAIRFESAAAQITGVSRSADSGVLVASIDMIATGATPFNLIFKSADLS